VFPARFSLLPLEGVKASFSARLSPVRADDDEILDEERIAVELDRRSVLQGVISPSNLPGLLVESPENTVARANEQQIPPDRGGGKDSTAGVEGPEEPRARSPVSAIGEVRR
jgi:hypothetical protein